MKVNKYTPQVHKKLFFVIKYELHFKMNRIFLSQPELSQGLFHLFNPIRIF